jgi:hypothetical protein
MGPDSLSLRPVPIGARSPIVSSVLRLKLVEILMVVVMIMMMKVLMVHVS